MPTVAQGKARRSILLCHSVLLHILALAAPKSAMGSQQVGPRSSQIRCIWKNTFKETPAGNLSIRSSLHLPLSMEESSQLSRPIHRRHCWCKQLLPPNTVHAFLRPGFLLVLHFVWHLQQNIGGLLLGNDGIRHSQSVQLRLHTLLKAVCKVGWRCVPAEAYS